MVTQDLKSKKVVLMGLDNGGKTSIALCLMGVKNLPSFCAIDPTRNYNINQFKVLDTDFSIWDFGGQEQYRNEHLSNFKENMKEADKVIFVIDVQDINRYAISLEFLGKVIQLLEEFDIHVDLSIFLHKFDPDLENTKSDISNEVVDEIINKIDNFIPKTIAYNIFKTTIYANFQKLKIFK
jgi:GTPase SAR1 family protein